MTISEIIKDWEMAHYPLGRIKKEKLMLKLFLFLIQWQVGKV